LQINPTKDFSFCDGDAAALATGASNEITREGIALFKPFVKGGLVSPKKRKLTGNAHPW
jgi:hypothetical protein